MPCVVHSCLESVVEQPSLKRSGRNCPRELLFPVKEVIVAGNDPNSVVLSRQRNQVVIIGVTGRRGNLGRVRHLVRQNRDHRNELKRIVTTNRVLKKSGLVLAFWCWV